MDKVHLKFAGDRTGSIVECSEEESKEQARLLGAKMSEADKTPNDWVEVYAKKLAILKGFRPNDMITFGEPERVNISNQGFAYIIPPVERQQEVWECFISEVQCAMAVTGDLPGHPRED